MKIQNCFLLREPHHDSYDEDHYGGDAYSVETSYTYEPSRKSKQSTKYRLSYRRSHEPRSEYRHKSKRAASGGAREGQIFGSGFGLGALKKLGNSEARVNIKM